MKKILIGMALVGFSLVVPISQNSAQAQSGSCSWPSAGNMIGSNCNYQHRTDVVMNSAHWPYSGVVFGPCVSSGQNSPVF